MSSWKSIAARRRAPLVIIPLFVLCAAVMGQFQPKLQERAQTVSQEVWLVDGSESVDAIHQLNHKVGATDKALAIIVFGTHDGSRLSAGQTAGIQSLVTKVEDLVEGGKLPKVDTALSPFGPEAGQRGQVARDGSTVTMLVPIRSTADPDLEPVVDRLREVTADAPNGVDVHVTGPAALTVDAVKVFGSIDGALLLGTVVLVLVLLLAIYRSPLVALVPLVSVAIAYTIAAGIVYLLDLEVNPQTTGILIVLMFGAGTDYCLLVVARYREELQRHESKHAAMAETLAHTTPAILSSGGTVIAAMLVLLVADSNPTRTMGPVLALGIVVTMLAGLLLLPAILVALGRRAFWPIIPRVGQAPAARGGFWRRVGNVVAKRPIVTLVVPVLLLLVLASGNSVSNQLLGFGSTDSFRKPTDSAKGYDLMEGAFPAGELAPNVVLVSGDKPADVAATMADVQDRFRGSTVVSRVVADPPGEHAAAAARAGRAATMTLVMRGDPFGEAAANAVPGVRRELRAAAKSHGTRAMLGGPTAQSSDTNEAASRDDLVIIPIVLAVIFVILVVLLRAVVAPLHLVASVVLSFFATLGLVKFLFANVLDQPGTTAGFATLLFIFVVALGVDYNIFLISRIREDSGRHGTRRGTLDGLASTGGIITSAGIILAGTFMVLASLPVLFLFQLGVAVAVGVLLDTFIVRGFIVPSVMLLLGERNWWPGGLDHGLGHPDHVGAERLATGAGSDGDQDADRELTPV